MTYPDDIPLAYVGQLRLRPGDTLAITLAGEISNEDMNAIADRIKSWHPDIHVLIMPPDSNIEILRSNR